MEFDATVKIQLMNLYQEYIMLAHGVYLLSVEVVLSTWHVEPGCTSHTDK